MMIKVTATQRTMIVMMMTSIMRAMEMLMTKTIIVTLSTMIIYGDD